MGKKKKGLGSRAFSLPIVVFRTPEEHRALIQPPRTQVSIKTKQRTPKSRAKRAKLSAQAGTSSLGGRMAAMGFRSYAGYLASPHWLDLRERWKASNMFKGWVCHSFGCEGKGKLSLHHWTYERLGHEDLNDLILVCEDCHRKIHRLERGGMPLDEATRRVTKQRMRIPA